jgi:hypothetical protein
MDPQLAAPVRSVRVATALADRFAILMQPGSYTNDEKFDNVLGEARQIYPSIWSNLDDARLALAARDVDLSAYDQLRATPAARLGGIGDVNVQEKTLITGGSKEAFFNSEGYAAARAACNILRDAMPGVDWRALEREEADQIAAFGSLGPPLWKKVIFYAIAGTLMAIAIVGYLYYRIGDP